MSGQRKCAGPGCSHEFVPYRAHHRFCCRSRSQRGKHHEGRNRPRAYKCQVSGCGRQGKAKGYCNAHYLRTRTGADMDKPARVADPNRSCAVSGCPGKHYGHGYCRKHFGLHRRLSATSRLIAALGGKCTDCGGTFPPEVFDFHHIGEKEFAISNKVGDLPYDKLLAEAQKCVLLCANCHRTRHATYSVVEGRAA